MDNWLIRRVEMDMDRIHYINSAVNAVLENEISAKPKSIEKKEDQAIHIDQDTIAQFCELFPDYNAGQAHAILKYYKGNAEDAIDAVLHSWLPAELPRLPMVDEQPTKPGPSSAEVVDFDELVPLKESGKRGTKNTMEDKSAIQSLKSFYSRYQTETQEEEYEALVGVKSLNAPLPAVLDNEDDEYDDTYDAQDVDTIDDQTVDEKTAAAATTGHGQKYGYHQPKEQVDNRQQHQTRDAGPSHRGGTSSYRGSYTGGRDRQDKERHGQHNRKDMAAKKHSKGFGFY